MAKSLKMVFALGDRTVTMSIPDPKNGLTRTQCQQLADKVTTNQAIMVSGVAATTMKDCYIQSSERQEVL